MPLFHSGNEITSERSEPSLDYFTLGCFPLNFRENPLGKQSGMAVKSSEEREQERNIEQGRGSDNTLDSGNKENRSAEEKMRGIRT